MTVFRERLDQLIARCGKQTVFADRCGLSPAVISSWRRGRTEPTAYTLRRVCMACECSADWLLGLRVHKPREAVGTVPSPQEVRDGFRDTLRGAVAASGLSSAQIAERIDSEPSTVRAWMSGRCLPSAAYLPKLAETLGLTLGELLGGDGG